MTTSPSPSGLPSPVPRLASCPCCGCLILAYDRLFSAGEPILWDPEWRDRRLVRAYLTADQVLGQGFSPVLGAQHECPPESECALKPRDRPGRIREVRLDIQGDGAYQRPHGPCRLFDPSGPEPGAWQ